MGNSSGALGRGQTLSGRPEKVDPLSLDVPDRHGLVPLCDWTSLLTGRHRYREVRWPSGALASVGVARGVARDALEEWGLTPLAGDVTECVSELVTNAHIHARRPKGSLQDDVVTLGLRLFPAQCLFVEVGDADPIAPHFPRTAVELNQWEQRGRGLLIVQFLADFLWWNRSPLGGKFVLARFDLARYFETREEDSRV